MSRETLATVLAEHEFIRLNQSCSCGWYASLNSGYTRQQFAEHVADALLAALPPPRGGDAAEEELGALLERLAEESYGVMFRKFTGEMAGMIGPYGAFSVGFIEEPRKDIISGGATPLAALQALDAALAEQQQQKSEE